ncbi:MAG: 1-acyl-sn-glycerol-3-phosphate acyltransferase [Gammaproteobacteria bacterium]|nr:1-acyl-sn-glycerol-3-phosphate acyltransferase [Gammaproteobacteria bacterium]
MTTTPVLWVRSLLFYCGYVLSTLLWGTSLTAIALFLPRRLRFRAVIPPWVGFVIWWLKITCGIKVHISGAEHLGPSSGILFMKHMSTWDALFSQLLISPQTTIIKRKLLWIPCFGWAFWVTNPIAIDRAQRMSALRHIVTEGKKRLQDGYWITLFPEGTRVPVGEVGRFQRGGAMLARQTGATTHFVAHNGGYFWRHNAFIKRPGIISLRISPPQVVGDRTAAEFNEHAEAWMRQQMQELSPHSQDRSGL